MKDIFSEVVDVLSNKWVKAIIIVFTLIVGTAFILTIMENRENALADKNNSVLEQKKASSVKMETVNQKKDDGLSTAEKIKVSNEIRDILKNGNAKAALDDKKYFNRNSSALGYDYHGTSRKFHYYYSTSITRNMTHVSFYDSVSIERGDSNYGSFIHIETPASFLTTRSFKYERPIGWDTIVFGNDDDTYVFSAGNKKKTTNPRRGVFEEEVYLGEEAEKCYKMLLGNNSYMCFLKGNEVLEVVKVHKDYKDDKEMLDAMYDVVRLIPKINSLKNEKGNAYLY